MSAESKPSRTERGDTRGQLLAAVGRTIARGGVAEATMPHVAAEAGLSVGAVYKYFRNRAALLAAWEADLFAGVVGRLEERLAEPITTGGLVPDAFFAVTRGSIDEISRTALQYRFAPGDPLILADPPERAAHGKRAAELLEAALVARGGVVLPRNPSIASRLVVTTCLTLPFGWSTDRAEDMEDGAFQDELASMFTRYLLREPTLQSPPAPPDGDLRRPILRAVPPDGSEAQRPAWHPNSTPPAAKEPRKGPQQKRSAETVAVVLEATKQLLLRDGADGITTTTVAARAGVSVGTVYQYYPTREAILAACEERTFVKLLTELTGALATGMGRVDMGKPLGEGGAYLLIRLLVDALSKNSYAHRFMAGDTDLAARPHERAKLLEQAVDFMSRSIAQRGENVFPRCPRRAAMLVLTTAVVLSFVWPSHFPEEVASGEFQRELATMITRYLVAKVSAEPYG